METKALTPEEFISYALAEDVGDGDHTTLATIPAGLQGRGLLRIKEEGIVCGLNLAAQIFRQVDSSISFKAFVADGEEASKGTVAGEATGPVSSLLTAERLVLNCMQRMSGIATATKRYVKLVEGTKARILDTRKTTPNFRRYEKEAVAAGGGVNHRFGLYDMILIKNNHVDACGGVGAAVRAAKEYLQRTGRNLPIEAETRSLEEVQAVLDEGGVQRIMFDNFSVDDMRKAVQLIAGRVETEASGNIREDTVAEYARTGVDFISVGAITHSFRSLDISLTIIPNTDAGQG